MRSRRSDGLWIVFLGLAAFTAAVSALPGPAAHSMTGSHKPHVALVEVRIRPGSQRGLPSSV